jgi:DNA polymerase-1
MVDHISGQYLHMLQTLMGDTVDNYDGIPGIGIKKAKAILEPAGLDPVLMWTLVVDAYVEHLCQFPSWAGDDIKVPELEAIHLACQQARLAKILQWEDYDNREVILWQPPV